MKKNDITFVVKRSDLVFVLMLYFAARLLAVLLVAPIKHLLMQ